MMELNLQAKSADLSRRIEDAAIAGDRKTMMLLMAQQRVIMAEYCIMLRLRLEALKARKQRQEVAR